jgi:ABC-2 type transport system permease protein
MNAVTETRHVPVVHPTHKFRLLLRREFWEHRGGFLWAPAVAGAIFLVLSVMGILVGEVAARRAAADGKLVIDNGQGITINGLDLGALTSKMSAEDMRQLAGGIDLSLLMASGWPLIVLAFVVFFYCLGALYDERKDRSVLFWKSLPLSDAETVLSKVASATVVAPVLAVGAALATMLGFLVVLSVLVLAHGGNPIHLLWGLANPFGIAAELVASIPVYALWSLPTVGWLLLCSAWARSKPFLWAIMIPVFSGIFVSWFDFMQLFNLESSWFWKNIVARVLLSTAPGSWVEAARFDNPQHTDGPAAVIPLINPATTWSTLLTPQLWIGVLAGAAMIVLAIRLRRWRDEG